MFRVGGPHRRLQSLVRRRVETDRGILLTPYDPDAEAALRVAAKAAKKYRNALRELAK